jgi:hypothetical protein
MTGLAIAAEVAAALAEAGAATGNGPLIGSLKKRAGNPAAPPQNPFAVATPPTPPAPVPVTIIEGSYDLRHIDGVMILATDRKVMMDATGPVPAPGDTLEIGGLDHAIISVRPEAPGGVALMYEVQCRR